jgi:hypothetical protein
MIRVGAASDKPPQMLENLYDAWFVASAATLFEMLICPVAEASLRRRVPGAKPSNPRTTLNIHNVHKLAR